MLLVGLCRLGRNAELKTSAAGKPVLNMALAYNHGQNKETQWVEVAAWGERFEKLAQYFVKGTAIVAYLDNVHIRTYEKKDGSTGFSLSATLRDFEFTGKSAGSSGEPAREADPLPRSVSGLSPKTPMQAVQDMDSDIPFSNPYRGRICYVV
jgi:single-stranded DNA-binding protein